MGMKKNKTKTKRDEVSRPAHYPEWLTGESQADGLVQKVTVQLNLLPPPRRGGVRQLGFDSVGS